MGTTLLNEVITAAREIACYKFLATSRALRAKVHELYEKLGFEGHDIEFRMNLNL